MVPASWRGGWPGNVWAGTTCGHPKSVARIEALLQIPAVVRFISAEPLLGNLDLDRYVNRLDWVIVGGESGSGARPMRPEWVRSIREQCQAAGVPFFFKQWGGVHKKLAGAELDGREWKQWPDGDFQKVGQLPPSATGELIFRIDTEGRTEALT